MTLKDGLAAMRNSRKEERTQEERGEERPAPTPQPPPPPKAAERREPFATRLKPSLRHGLKRRVLELSEQGKRVTVEDVIETLLLRYTKDEAFQQEVEETLG